MEQSNIFQKSLKYGIRCNDLYGKGFRVLDVVPLDKFDYLIGGFELFKLHHDSNFVLVDLDYDISTYRITSMVGVHHFIICAQPAEFTLATNCVWLFSVTCSSCS